MTISNPVAANGKPFKTITVDGEVMRPTAAWWVVFGPDGKPLKAFPSALNIMDNIATAARVAWYGNSEAILALNAGHRIELMSSRRFFKTVAPDLP